MAFAIPDDFKDMPDAPAKASVILQVRFGRHLIFILSQD